jgi:Protein of unknown function (DUF3224)
MTTRAQGTFEVRMTPVATDEKPGTATLGRLTLDKQYRGDLEASSTGEMLSAMTSTKGSAGYVAIERVTGTLHGRSGTFVLQHHGIMNRGHGTLSIGIVPDSGTGQLTGLGGSMKIIIESGKHSYELEYTVTEGAAA